MDKSKKNPTTFKILVLLVQVHSGVSGMAHLEVELQQEGNVLPLDDGGQLEELPFTPVHAPVITLGTSAPR